MTYVDRDLSRWNSGGTMPPRGRVAVSRLELWVLRLNTVWLAILVLARIL